MKAIKVAKSESVFFIFPWDSEILFENCSKCYNDSDLLIYGSLYAPPFRTKGAFVQEGHDPGYVLVCGICYEERHLVRPAGLLKDFPLLSEFWKSMSVHEKS